jgi:hypothetical protein
MTFIAILGIVGGALYIVFWLATAKPEDPWKKLRRHRPRK